MRSPWSARSKSRPRPAPLRLESVVGPETQRLGTLRHYEFLQRLVMGVLILNLLDGVLTLIWINAGTATEANPLLAQLAHQYPVPFMLTKLSLVGLGSILLWRFRKRASSVIAIFIAFLVYYFLLLYHLSALELRLLSRWWD